MESPAALRLVAPPIPNVSTDIVVNLSFTGPIVPGQPISFFWKDHTVATRPLDIGTVTASIYLLSATGNPAPNPLFQVTLSAGESISPGDFTSQTYTFTPPSDQARTVYQIQGRQILRLILTGTGADGGPYFGDAALNVMPEQVDTTWWEWTVPAYRQVQWKVDHYSFNGVFHNRSKYAVMTANISLIEQNSTDQDPPDKNYPPDQPAAVAVPQQDDLITYGQQDFSKTWHWTIPVLWIPNGARVKRFFYSVRVDMSDEFDNSYTNATLIQSPTIHFKPVPFSFPLPQFATVTVDVRVSDLKWAANATALGLMVVAGELLAIAAIVALIPFIGWAVAAGFSAAATAVASVAFVVGNNIALDPPAPDPRYKEAVELRSFDIPKVLLADGRWKDMVSWIELIGHMAACGEVLGLIESRMLGASAAGDSEALAMQEAAYKSAQQELAVDAGKIQLVSTQAAKSVEFDEKLALIDFKGPVQQLQTTGLSVQLRQAWTDAGGSADLLARLEQNIRDPSIIGRLMSNQDFGVVANWLVQLANAAQKETPTVLK